jgi:hypothetical protein
MFIALHHAFQLYTSGSVGFFFFFFYLLGALKTTVGYFGGTADVAMPVCFMIFKNPQIIFSFICTQIFSKFIILDVFLCSLAP